MVDFDISPRSLLNSVRLARENSSFRKRTCPPAQPGAQVRFLNKPGVINHWLHMPTMPAARRMLLPPAVARQRVLLRPARNPQAGNLYLVNRGPAVFAQK